MSMVCGLDLHRQQITFDAMETESGEVWRGRVWQPDRERFRRWLRHDVARTRQRAAGGDGGGGLHRLALRGRGDRRRPGSRRTSPSRPTRRRRGAASIAPRPIGPTPGCCASCCSVASCPSRGSRRRSVLEWRERVRLYKSLVDQRRVWIAADPRRAVPARRRRARGGDPLGRSTRALAGQRRGDLSPAARQRIRVGYAMIDATDAEALPLKAQLQRFGHAPAGLPGAGRRQLRDRRADRGGGVVRARRLSPLLPLRAGGAPHRLGRHRRLLRPAPRRRLPVPAGTADVALGAVRSRA